MELPLAEYGISRKRYSDEDCLKILRQVEVELAIGANVANRLLHFARNLLIRNGLLYKLLHLSL